MKTCSRCQKEKPAELFYLRKGAPDGREGVCRDCRKEMARRRLRQDPNARSRQVEATREWRRKNPQASVDATRRYRLKHPEKTRDMGRAQVAAWRKNNSEKYLARASAAAAQRRACAHAAAANLTDEDKELIKDLYRLAAIYRQAGVDAHVDHIVPLRHPIVCGLHVPANLSVVLAEHNLRKSNRWRPDVP